jgi:hypothetical protein
MAQTKKIILLTVSVSIFPRFILNKKGFLFSKQHFLYIYTYLFFLFYTYSSKVPRLDTKFNTPSNFSMEFSERIIGSPVDHVKFLISRQTHGDDQAECRQMLNSNWHQYYEAFPTFICSENRVHCQP